MKLAERAAPVAAVASALASLVCCLPIGVLAGAAVSASLSAVVDRLRPWLLGASIGLIAMAMWQVYRARGACPRPPSRASIVLLWLCAGIVIVVLLFPQVIAGILADWLP